MQNSLDHQTFIASNVNMVGGKNMCIFTTFSHNTQHIIEKQGEVCLEISISITDIELRKCEALEI